MEKVRTFKQCTAKFNIYYHWLVAVVNMKASSAISNQAKYEQEAHGPRVAHLSDIATADMQMLCNIFPILSSQLMKRSSFK